MIGEIIFIEGREEVIVSEVVVTRYVDETKAQMRERVRAGRPLGFYSFTVVTAERVVQEGERGSCKDAGVKQKCVRI